MNLGFYKEKEGLKWIYPFFPLLLIVGFILRILFSPSWTYEGDFGSWKGWAYGISKVGFSEFYDEYWCDYMPGYLYILWLLQHLHTAFPMIPDTILFKLPANLSDLGISIVIFYVLRNITNVRNAKIASLAYFFNPASRFNFPRSQETFCYINCICSYCFHDKATEHCDFSNHRIFCYQGCY